MSKPKITISFSGGRSSAVMAKLVMDAHKESHDIIVTFANTGCEHPDTLRFVRDATEHFKLNTVWLECKVHPEKGEGVTYTVVDFDTASRNGEPFEAAIAKYGIFNSVNPSCTARLKTDVMEAYLADNGFYRGKRLNYDTAIGIRADELDRVSIRAEQERFVYPLVKYGYTKQMVKDYMKQFDWDLRIPEHLGNCTWCWKKSHRKHLTLALDHPEVFNFPQKMDEKYGEFKADCAAGKDGKRRFFRKYKSTQDILDEAAFLPSDFVKYTDESFDYSTYFDPDLDMNTGCSESCEVYSTDGT